MVEHPAVNRQVVGSSPTLGANCAGVAELADAQDLKSCDVNSSYRFDSGPRHQFLGPMVKRLRHRPFTAVTRVRIPVGSPFIIYVAEQLSWLEHAVHTRSVRGSSPFSATIFILYFFTLWLYLGAQLSWESICLTSRGSQVRALLCPPNMAWQFSWLECQPVTLEVVGSSPIQVANKHAGVAQLVEQLTCNQQVRGSSPPTSSIFAGVAQWQSIALPRRGSRVRISSSAPRTQNLF